MNRDEALAFVEQYHRHCGRLPGDKCAIGAAMGEKVVGVAIIGRPTAAAFQDGWTLEVTRNCTDGTRNACSFLYAAAWRVARALGYRRLVTYTRPGESGASLRASGFTLIAERKGGSGSWDSPARPRVNKNPRQHTFLWEKTLDDAEAFHAE
ncbi:MAG: hypothetical protein L0212_04015 [Acidobacteria bacterium]|nr:hypothetical protein [Acidobacteriota bacterium]